MLLTLLTFPFLQRLVQGNSVIMNSERIEVRRSVNSIRWTMFLAINREISSLKLEFKNYKLTNFLLINKVSYIRIAVLCIAARKLRKSKLHDSLAIAQSA